MIKVAVIGSCVSRDNFNSSFIKGYKDFYTCVFHQNQPSMISLMADPIPFEYSKLDGEITPNERRQLSTELEKSALNHLLINEPDYIIVDFYGDVRFGIREFENSIVTGIDHRFFRNTLFREGKKGRALNLSDNTEEYLTLWKESTDQFFDFINVHLPNTKVIINSARFVSYYLDEKSNELLNINNKIMSFDVERLNKLWDILDDYVENKQNVTRFEFKDKFYPADMNHPWGLYHVHYVNSFYQDFTHKLLAFILSDLKNEKKSRTSPADQPNLILNSTFNENNAFWTTWESSFEIGKDDEDNQFLMFEREGLSEDSIRKCFSNLIEINGDGEKMFNLSFDVRIDSSIELDSFRTLFCIRAFDKLDQYNQKDSRWNTYIKADDYINENDSWININIDIKPVGKYIRLAPFIFRNGKVSWKNIEFKKGTKDSKQIMKYPALSY